MLELLIGMFVGGLLYSIVVDNSTKVNLLEIDIECEKERTNFYKSMAIDKEIEYDSLLLDYNELIDEYNTLVKKYKNNKNNGPKINDSILKIDLVKKAIKKAMIHSHPDKGGNAEDFIAFRELYKNIMK